MNRMSLMGADIKKRKDIVLLLFILYVTPLCIYLQSLFFATTNAWGAVYILMLIGLMLINRRFSLQVKKTDVLLFVFILIACFSSLRAGAYLYFMQALLVLLFVWGYTKYNLNDLYRYLDILIIFGIVCALSCIIQEFWHGFFVDLITKLFKPQEVETILRLEKNMGNCGIMPQTAHSAGSILNAFFILMLKKSNIRRKLILGAILLVGLLFTGKRAHLFMGMLVFVISFFIGLKGKKKIMTIVKSIILTAILSNVLLLIVPFPPRDNTISKGVYTITHFDIDDEDIMHGRQYLYSKAIMMGNSAPITGHGWGSFKNTVEYRDGHTDVHNIYLQLYAEQGGIVLAMFILSAFIIIYSNMTLLKKIKCKYHKQSEEIVLTKLALCFILFFYFYGLTGNPLYDIDYLIVFGVGVSIIKKMSSKGKSIGNSNIGSPNEKKIIPYNPFV